MNAINRYAIIGHPVEHSKSPFIHRWFASETGQGLRYDLLPSPPDQFEATVRRFRDEGGVGLNVTMPFKREAHDLATERTPRAALAGAANTLSFRADGGIHADNTDGVGLIRDLVDNHGTALAGRRILMVGAGGAVRGVLLALLDERPAQLVVTNRTAERARELAESFPGIAARGFGELGAEEPFDVVINATPAESAGGRAPPVPLSALRPGGVAYDMTYTHEPTPFMLWSRAAGAALSIDGTGMLVEQGAESFRVWRGAFPSTARVIAALRANLANG